MALTEEEQDQLSKLGHEEVELPEGKTEAVSDTSEENPGLDQVDPEETGEEQEVDTSTQEEGVSEEQRRTWQSEADKAKAEAEKAREELEAAKQREEYMVRMLSGLQTPQQQPEKKEDKEPELTDYINPGEYDKYDALDPSTQSGQAYHKWQSDLNDYRAERKLKQYEQTQEEKRREEIALRQAQRLAERVPEFRNPITGKPDIAKIESWMSEISNSDDPDMWAKLYNFMNNNKSAPTTDKIGKRASATQSVASQTSSEKEKKPVPKTFQKMANVFGRFEYPEGADFE